MALSVAVEVEEVLCEYEPADNGAGPLWCHGSTVVARRGDEVYAAALETLPDQVPLNNCRWLLYRRTDTGWALLHRDESGRTREPSPVALLASGDLLVSANPTLAKPGQYGGPSEPTVFRFNTGDLSAPPTTELPVFAGEPAFSEHSYRTVTADGAAGEVLYMQNVGYEVAHMSLLSRDGAWRPAGEIRWPYGGEYPDPQPLRLCYPNVTLRDRAAHFFGVGDIVEPVEAWKRAKHEITGRDWDYVFRRLFYASTPDVATEPFGEWLEIVNHDSTAGATRNCDIQVDPAGAAHLLWTESNTDARLRDRFFPGVEIRDALEYAVVHDGEVVQRLTLAAALEAETGPRPLGARFHVTACGTLLVLAQFAHKPTPEAEATVVYRLGTVGPNGINAWVDVPFARPMAGTFLTNTGRGGSPPSDTIDLVGTVAGPPQALGYARLQTTRE